MDLWPLILALAHLLYRSMKVDRRGQRAEADTVGTSKRWLKFI
jgi:hypothetical protein